MVPPITRTTVACSGLAGRALTPDVPAVAQAQPRSHGKGHGKAFDRMSADENGQI